jgi:polar amino acid transport system substrate-binding protein
MAHGKRFIYNSSEGTHQMKNLARALFLAAAFLSGCSSQPDEQKIRVAVTPASPPNLYEDNGKTTGMDLELFEGFAKEHGYVLEITAYDWQGMLGAVISGQADVAFSGISITDKRKEVMDFSKPYMDNTWNLISLKSRNIKFDDLAEWKSYSTGYPRGMAYTDFIKNKMEPKGYYSLDQVKLYPSYNEVLTDLRNGNIDLAFVEGGVSAIYKKKLPLQDSHVFSGFDQFGYAFPKGSAMRDEFNTYLDKLGPDELATLKSKWFD